MIRVVALLVALGAVAAAERCQIVDNFTTDLPSSATIACTTVPEARVGLCAASVAYRWEPGQKRALVEFPDLAFPIGGAGTLRLWVKGDGSGNRIRLVVRTARSRVERDGQRRLYDHGDVGLETIALDSTDWREVRLPFADLPADRVAWWQRLEVTAGDGDRPASGTFTLDDLRLEPKAAMGEGSVAMRLIGPRLRELGQPLAVGVDVRNFGDRAGTLRARLTVTDRNQNVVLDRDLPIPVAAGGADEVRIPLDSDQLALYLPPFRIAGDVLGADFPQLAGRMDEVVVVGNARALVAGQGDALAQWFTAGTPPPYDKPDRVPDWLTGAGQRASPAAQTTARLSRLDVPESEAQAAEAANLGAPPLGRYALGIAYAGAAVAYRGADRLVPGDAYAVGAWVRGDGSGARIVAAFIDYSDLSDYGNHGWRRQYVERELCVLDFTGWRWCEVDLPGGGRGTNLPKGSTQDVDFPWELTLLRVTPRDGAAEGVVAVGPIYARTQVAPAETLAVQLAYDDADQRFAPGLGAWLAVSNGALGTSRDVAGRWELVDRDGKAIASGTVNGSLAAGAAAWRRIELPASASDAPGPLLLQASVADARDATVSATRALALAKPDSLALHADFETDRGYLGLKADGAEAPDGEAIARTTDEDAHGGRRSLAIAWTKERPTAYVAIDPALPGVPTEVALWVRGDGSGALVHPVIGDHVGIAHGMATRTYDLLLARTEDGRNAVAVDWTGWRRLVFRLPAIPPDWAKQAPVRPWVPSYPLGLHLAVDGRGATGAGGRILVDDIVVATHLPSERRVTLSAQRDGLANVVLPGEPLRVRLASAETSAARVVRLTGGLVDHAGRVVAAPPAGDVTLAPGETRWIALDPPPPPGAYALRVSLVADGATVAATDDDLVVGDPAPLLGERWRDALADEWALRKPLGDRVVVVDEDWDWVESHPGNLQLDTLRGRSQAVTDHGMSPWPLLGFSAYWASGIGLHALESGSFQRAPRDIGHGCDIFLVPERIEQWRDYVREAMRGVGDRVGGFVLWDNPDGTSSLAMPPAKLAELLAETDRWRRRYCAQTPLIVGGMAQATALPYLAELVRAGGGEHLGGVNVRFDVGRLTPEDAEVAEFARRLLGVVDPHGDRRPFLWFTDLDWSIERGADGIDAFVQAAYLVRADLALQPVGIAPALTVRNADKARLGPGLAYRATVEAPPLKEQPATYLLKPGWWAMARCRRLFAGNTVAAVADVADLRPGRTRALLLRGRDGAATLVAWRDDDDGMLSLGDLAVRSTEDCFGAAVAAHDGWYPLGGTPILFRLDLAAEAAAARLDGLRVRDGDQPAWPQRPIAAIRPGEDAHGYRQHGGEPTTIAGDLTDGRSVAWPALRFAPGGDESWRVAVPTGCGVVLRHRYLLDDTGCVARLRLDGRDLGAWDLRRSAPELSGGARESSYLVPADAIAGRAEVEIEVTYDGAATSGGWIAYAYAGGPVALSAYGALHADQAVGRARAGRTLIGAPLRIGQDRFADGIAVYADSLLEYPLGKRFARLRARVGIDAATDGRGSAVFEVWADGAKRWSSPTMSGLDAAREVDVDLGGVERLRLVVRDGGDGNRFDAGIWADARLEP